MPRPENANNPSQLVPPGGRWSGPVGRRFRHHNALVPVAVVAVGGYALLAAFLVGSGLLFTHVLAHTAVGRWDDHVNAWFAAHRSPFWTHASAVGTFVANTLGVVVVAAVVSGVLLLRKWGRLAALILIGLAIELAVFLSTTYVVARPRPQVPHLGSTPSTFSWPSGHAAATFVLYGGIAVLVALATTNWVLRVAAWVVAAAVTGAVAVSRVYRGEHHPTDVFAGVVLGIGALSAAVFALRAADAASAAKETATEPAPDVPEHRDGAEPGQRRPEPDPAPLGAGDPIGAVR
ncbi:MAG TPA: phosphatase PAP2 family protein [Acidimicrobiales bacterium]|nr:phosphatase PAP2 family protein [Acidimicrobiales bacterium]